MPIDKDALQEILDDLNEWHKKIIRKNASQNEDLVEERKNNIIRSYNALVEFCKPIFAGNNNDDKKLVKDALVSARNFIVDDLNTLNADIEVPRDLTKKIQITNSDDNNKKNNDKNNEPSNNDQKPNTSGVKNNDHKKNDTNKGDDKNNKTDKTNIKHDSDIKHDPETSHSSKNKKSDKERKAITMEEIIKFTGHLSKIITTTYKGDPNGLSAFISAIELANSIATEQQQSILVKYIKTKLEGRALEAIPAEANTADLVMAALKNKIKTETSKVVMGRLLALRAERNALPKFQMEAENLADQLRRAFISEGMTTQLAEKMTVDKTVEMCRLSAKTSLVKSVLASSSFTEPKEVLAKLITESSTESNESQVLYYRNNNHNGYRGRGQQNNYRNNRQNYRQNNFQRAYNNQRGRNPNNFYRGNRNRRYNHNHNNNNNNNRQNNPRVRIINEENGQAPVPQRGQSVAEVENQ